LRSEDPAALASLEREVHSIVARYQSLRWQQAGVAVSNTLIGDRPGGSIPDDHPLVRAAIASLRQQRVLQLSLRISSTDADVLSRGIPPSVSGSAEGGNAHRTDEWIATAPIASGVRHLFDLVCWTADWLAASPPLLKSPIPKVPTMSLLKNRPEDEQLTGIRHSSTHILAQAVLEIHPDAKIADRAADRPRLLLRFRPGKDEQGKIRTFTPEELEQIEKRMRQIVAGKHPFLYREVSAEEARRNLCRPAATSWS
jgi:hypothetical protein